MGKSKGKSATVAAGSRKEARKLDRARAKMKRKEHHTKKEGDDMRGGAREVMRKGPLTKILEARRQSTRESDSIPKGGSIKPAEHKLPLHQRDPRIEEEDKEIRRLEKLLGIDKGGSRKKAAEKLNKEYRLYEGFDSNFGDFLMDLDGLTDELEGKSGPEKAPRFEVDDTAAAGGRGFRDIDRFGGHFIDEDEQEESDIDIDGDKEDEDPSSDEYGAMVEGGEEEDDDDDDDEEEEESIGESGSRDGNDAALDADVPERVATEEEEESCEEGTGSQKEQEDSSNCGDAEFEKDRDTDDYDDDDDDDCDDDADDDAFDQHDRFTYRPAAGEDIYGRSTAAVGGAADASRKYIPPAKRKAALMSAVDENDENVRILRRQINGLMNKLSDQSKDSIVRSLKSIFAANSVTVATHVLKDAIMAACSHPTQVMTSLIPTYAAVVAALHCTHSIDVGAHMVEHLVLALHKSVVDASPSSGDSTTAGQSIGGGRPAQHGESLISSKLPANALLLLVYLYNLRVVHHALIVDIMKMFADCDSLNGGSDDTNSTGIGAAHLELRMELLELLINNCGSSIRSDDPDSLKLVLADLSKQYSAMQQLNDSSIQQKQPQLGLMSSTGRSAGDDSNADSTAKSGSSSSRVRFLCAALADLRSNSKSRRAQSGSAEAVRRLRKWLGSVKTSLAGGPGGQHSSSADPCLRVGLQDLLTADTRGRWWRTGAYWSGNPGDTASGAPTGAPTGEAGGTASQGKQAQKKAKTNAPHDSGKGSADAEQRQLLELAAAMHMNTATRRRIFVVLMSSQDVCDAFERLSRLALRGKEDREVARVLAECCAQERVYNPFYAEVAKLLCEHQRQNKVTFQFVFWDAFKNLMDGPGGDDGAEAAVALQRKAVNLARLLAQLVCSFHLPLTVIKPIDMTDMTPHVILFLSTFVLAMFKEKISEDDFQSVLDRVATSKDYAVVRDNLLFFLQRYLPKIPKGLDPEDTKLMQKRRKAAIKTMGDMSILDISRGAS